LPFKDPSNIIFSALRPDQWSVRVRWEKTLAPPLPLLLPFLKLALVPSGPARRFLLPPAGRGGRVRPGRLRGKLPRVNGKAARICQADDAGIILPSNFWLFSAAASPPPSSVVVRFISVLAGDVGRGRLLLGQEDEEDAARAKVPSSLSLPLLLLLLRFPVLFFFGRAGLREKGRSLARRPVRLGEGDSFFPPKEEEEERREKRRGGKQPPTTTTTSTPAGWARRAACRWTGRFRQT